MGAKRGCWRTLDVGRDSSPALLPFVKAGRLAGAGYAAPIRRSCDSTRYIPQSFSSLYSGDKNEVKPS